MSVLWTSATAAAATGGQATSDWQASGVSIDTRTLQPGDLFVALKDVRDGHDFVVQALDEGAAAALVSRVPDGVADDAPLLIVPDVLRGLEALGIAARARTQARVVGVTGSVGKTSTKEMLRAVLVGQGKTHCAEASYNNHWGVPLTLARMPQDTEFAVIEIGMNHPGEIAPLAKMARPHVAMITTIAAAHLEAFDSLAGIAREKAAILDGLEPGGVAVLPGDLDVSPILIGKATEKGVGILTFGAETENDYNLLSVDLHAGSTQAQAQLRGRALRFTLNTAGRHFATNALGVLAVAEALALDVDEVAGDLPLWLPPQGRGAREALRLPGVGTIELIDDAFNANPTSLSAALEVLAAAIAAPRRVAVLGDMLELGPDEVAQHAAIADDPAMAGVDLVHCVGPLMQAGYAALPAAKRGEWHETAQTMAERLPQLVAAGDVVLVKGSKGSKVSLVVDALRKLGQAAPTES